MPLTIKYSWISGIILYNQKKKIYNKFGNFGRYILCLYILYLSHYINGKNSEKCAASIFGSDYLSFAYQRTSASLNNFIICIIFTFLSTADNVGHNDEAAGW